MSAPSDTLDPLQRKVLSALAGMEPQWTLVGGAALAGLYLHHRTTRDLDLFWRGQDRVGPLAEECARRLRVAGVEVAVLQTAPAFVRLRAAEGSTTVVVDLVADPVPPVEPPLGVQVGGMRIMAASPHEILVDKLCALLGRAEVRDLVDIRALLAAGGELLRALRDAPRRDAGFSPLTLAWVLRGMQVDALARLSGMPTRDSQPLAAFRDELAVRVARAADPDAP